MFQECKISFTLKNNVIHHIDRKEEKTRDYFNRCGKKYWQKIQHY